MYLKFQLIRPGRPNHWDASRCRELEEGIVNTLIFILFTGYSSVGDLFYITFEYFFVRAASYISLAASDSLFSEYSELEPNSRDPALKNITQTGRP